jgi:hypothetical protein
MILAVVVVRVIRGRDADVLWTETLLIVLAHYFTHRRFVNLPTPVLRRLEDEGYVEKEPHPLYLPRNSIRVIVVLTFIGLAVYLYRADQMDRPEALSILGVVAAYLVGVLVRGLVHWFTGGRPHPAVWWWDDVKALVVLGVLVLATVVFMFDLEDQVPKPARTAVLGVVLFYFGSR